MMQLVALAPCKRDCAEVIYKGCLGGRWKGAGGGGPRTPTYIPQCDPDVALNTHTWGKTLLLKYCYFTQLGAGSGRLGRGKEGLKFFFKVFS